MIWSRRSTSTSEPRSERARLSPRTPRAPRHHRGGGNRRLADVRRPVRFGGRGGSAPARRRDARLGGRWVERRVRAAERQVRHPRRTEAPGGAASPKSARIRLAELVCRLCEGKSTPPAAGGVLVRSDPTPASPAHRVRPLTSARSRHSAPSPRFRAMQERYDVIVIGGGHAGTEAAALAARVGRPHAAAHPESRDHRPDVLQSRDRRDRERHRRARSRCARRDHGPRDGPGANPVPDAQPIEGARRLVAASPVRPRALPPSSAGTAGAETEPAIGQGTVAGLAIERGEVRGVETQDGRRYSAGAVVLTAGTFLRGVIHLGLDTRVPAGRAGDYAGGRACPSH